MNVPYSRANRSARAQEVCLGSGLNLDGSMPTWPYLAKRLAGTHHGGEVRRQFVTNNRGEASSQELQDGHVTCLDLTYLAKGNSVSL